MNYSLDEAFEIVGTEKSLDYTSFKVNDQIELDADASIMANIQELVNMSRNFTSLDVQEEALDEKRLRDRILGKLAESSFAICEFARIKHIGSIALHKLADDYNGLIFDISLIPVKGHLEAVQFNLLTAFSDKKYRYFPYDIDKDDISTVPKSVEYRKVVDSYKRSASALRGRTKQATRYTRGWDLDKKAD